MPLLARLTIAVVAAMALPPPALAVARAPWRAPVTGAVVARFAYSPSQPFARGARRGVDFAASAGEPVRAPCGGIVAYAGRVPRSGAGVTLRCGRLTATVLNLGTVSVRRGAFVLPGALLGRAGDTGHIRLGARETARRFAYRDPLSLLGAASPQPTPALPTFRGRIGPREEPTTHPPLLAPPNTPASAGAAVPSAGVSRAVWAGLALTALALPAGGFVAGRRRRRSRLATTPSPAGIAK